MKLQHVSLRHDGLSGQRYRTLLVGRRQQAESASSNNVVPLVSAVGA